MKIAISSRAPSPSSEVDQSFGRAYWYLIYDLAGKEWITIDNSVIRNSVGNAGQMASDLLKAHEVDVIITGETGPKAFRCLTAHGIQVYHGAVGTVEENLLAWSLQKITPAQKPNSKGSPYCLSGETNRHPRPIPEAPKLELAGMHFVGGR
jgi:predicted Fe-Mo cluster-binding NifX family protein